MDGVSKLRDARNQAKAILGNVAKGKALGEDPWKIGAANAGRIAIP